MYLCGQSDTYTWIFHVAEIHPKKYFKNPPNLFRAAAETCAHKKKSLILSDRNSDNMLYVQEGLSIFI